MPRARLAPISTGRWNALGRPIYTGAKGGKSEFVMQNGRYVPARKTTRAVGQRRPMTPGPVTNARGRTIMYGPRGGAYVMVGGKKVSLAAAGPRRAPAARSPSTGKYRKRATSPERATTRRTVRKASAKAVATANVDAKGRTIFVGPKGGLFVIGPSSKPIPIPPARRRSKA